MDYIILYICMYIYICILVYYIILYHTLQSMFAFKNNICILDPWSQSQNMLLFQKNLFWTDDDETLLGISQWSLPCQQRVVQRRLGRSVLSAHSAHASTYTRIHTHTHTCQCPLAWCGVSVCACVRSTYM